MKKIISLFFILVFGFVFFYSFNMDSSNAEVIDYKNILYNTDKVFVIDMKEDKEVKTISKPKQIMEFIDNLNIDSWKVYEKDRKYKGKNNDLFSYKYILNDKKYKIEILVSNEDNVVKFRSVDFVMCFEVNDEVMKYLNYV